MLGASFSCVYFLATVLNISIWRSGQHQTEQLDRLE